MFDDLKALHHLLRNGMYYPMEIIVRYGSKSLKEKYLPEIARVGIRGVLGGYPSSSQESKIPSMLST